MSDSVRSHGLTALGPLHEAFARLTQWKAAGAAFLLGALTAFAYAPFHLTAVLLISFTGLVWMIDGARAHRRWGRSVFLRGWAFGTGYFLVSMHWTAAPFLVHPEQHLIFIWMPLILLPAGMALIWGAFMAMAGAFWSASPSRVFVFTVFFTLAEFVRGHLFGGFPWNLAGTSWTPGGAFSQAASLGGIYWLTLLTVFVMASPAAFVDTRHRKGLMLRLAPSVGAVVLMALGWTWGAQRLMTPVEPGTRIVTLLDSGVPQEEATSEGAFPIFSFYLEQLEKQPGQPGDIVIWPEGAVPAYLLQDPFALDEIVARLNGRILIFGTARSETVEGERRDYFNSLAVIDETASRTGPIAIYDKHRLVPFGELAAADIIPGGDKISALLPPAMQEMAVSGFAPGNGPSVIDYEQILPPFVALICYEGLYPSVSRRANFSARADWIVLISADSWFGPGMGPAQHFAQNRYRAIENGQPLARVASRGATAIVDPYGRIHLRSEAITEGVPPGWKPRYARGALPQPAALTLYQTRLGVALLWVTLTLCVLLAFLSWKR